MVTCTVGTLTGSAGTAKQVRDGEAGAQQEGMRAGPSNAPAAEGAEEEGYKAMPQVRVARDQVPTGRRLMTDVTATVRGKLPMSATRT